MKISDFVAYVRQNVDVTNPVAEPLSTAPLILTDDQIKQTVAVSVTRDYPSVDVGTEVPDKYVYAVLLLVKKELYFYLATKYSELYYIEDDGSVLKRDQVWNHYMNLAKEIDGEYKEYMEMGGAGGSNNTLNTFDSYLSDRYYTVRNYTNEEKPTVVFTLDYTGSTYIELTVSYSCSRFSSLSIYTGATQLFDEYDEAKEVPSITSAISYDPKKLKFRVDDLTPNTAYHIGVEVQSASTLKGRSEKVFSTLV